MKITISKESILKSRILFLNFVSFILAALFLASCSNSEGMAGTDDTVLIAKIENAKKTTIEAASLPSTIVAVFDTDLRDSFIERAELAVRFGFKISIATDNIAREEGASAVFFNEKGRQLKDNRSKEKSKRNKCFEFVFPIDFIMPDATVITLTEKADWLLIKEWYTENSDATERATIVFPVDVTLEDGTVQTLLDSADLKEVKGACKKGKDKRKCFRLVLPVSFTMPDASIITVTERADFKLVKAWYKENTGIKEKGVLNYPLEIVYKDDTRGTINNQDEWQEAKEACKS